MKGEVVILASRPNAIGSQHCFFETFLTFQYFLYIPLGLLQVCELKDIVSLWDLTPQPREAPLDLGLIGLTKALIQLQLDSQMRRYHFYRKSPLRVLMKPLAFVQHHA